MADYDLGKAHGKVVIDYEDTGSKQAQSEMKKIDDWGQKLVETFGRLRREFSLVNGQFGQTGAQMARTFAIMTGGTAVLLGLSRATGTFAGRIFQLRGGMAIFGALGVTLGGLPKSVQGFPNIIKQIILLSSAITLFAGSTRLLNSVFVALGRFAASTQIIQRLTAAFPFLTGVIGDLAKRIPSIGKIGELVDGFAKPIHSIARFALGIGAMISIVRTGVSTAFALTKQLGKMAAAALLLDTGIKVVAGFIAALKEMSGAIGILPGAFAAAGVAAAAFSLGIRGVKDALKNIKDVAKFEEALKKLAPAAADTLREIRKMVPEFERIQRIVQQHLFADLARDVRKMGEIYLPAMQHGLGRVAIELNGVVRQALAFATNARTMGSVNQIIEATIGMLRNLRGAVQPLLSGLLDILVVSTQVFTGMFGNIQSTAQAFANWAAAVRADGSLKAWIEQGLQGLRDLGFIIFNVLGILQAFFAVFSTDGESVLGTIRNATQAFKEFLQVGEGRAILEQLATSLSAVADVAGDVLGVVVQELGPAFVALRPFVEELTTAIGVTLIAALKILGPILTGIAEALSFLGPVLGPLVGFFLGLGIAGKAFVLIIGPIVAGVNLLIGVFAALRTAFTVIKIAWLTLQFIFAVSPWTIIIAGIILLVTLIIMNWDKISAFLIKAWEWIKDKAIQIWGAIRAWFIGTWQNVVEDAKAAWNSILNFFKQIWEAIKFVFLNFTVVGLIIKYWDEIKAFTVGVWNSIVEFLTGIWNSIVNATRFIWEPIVEIIKSIFSIINDIIYIVVGAILIFLIKSWEVIRDSTIAAWTAISDFFTMVWGWIVAKFHELFDPLVEWWNKMWTAVDLAARLVWDTISQWLADKWAWVLAKWHEFWDPIAAAATWLWDTVKRIVQEANDWIGQKVSEAWAWVQRKFHEIWDPIARFFSNIWRQISDTTSNGVNTVVEWVKGIPGRILGAIGDLGSTLLSAGRRIIEGFLNGLKEKFRDVQNFVGGIADWIRANKGPLSYDAKLLTPAGTAIMNGLLNSMVAMKPQIVGFLEGLTSDIAGGLNGAAGQIMDANASLSSSASLGVLNNAATAMTDPATLSQAIGAFAKPVPVAPSAAPVSGSTVVIEKVEIDVKTLADPTDPIEWKKVIDAIHEGIRLKEMENK